jgi:low temperature requirement protein LtrA
MVIRPGRRMVARETNEEHRVSTPLELLFDLTFVVAVSRVAAELSHAIAGGHPGERLIGYLMVFFAIWWAWVNFTWFASAYDVDDVPYRLLTLVQMAGVLVLAAGVPAAFEQVNYTAVTIGYVIMRVAMVAQWMRAARNDPPRHATAMRYIIGTVAVQAGWLLRLALPQSAGAGFALLVIAELAVPIWAERREQTSWHPQHIAERYGLFTIIVLGECVLAATTAVGAQADGHLGGVELLVVAAGGLAMLFALWWLYFLKPTGEALAQRRSLAFWWGYGHYGIFASTAALGAALEVEAERAQHAVEASDPLIGWAVAVPVAIFIALVWGLHAPLGAAPAQDAIPVLGCVVVVLAVPAVTLAGVPASWVVALIAAAVIVLLAFAGRDRIADQPSSSPGRKV